MLIAAVHMSPYVTFLPCRNVCCSVDSGREADIVKTSFLTHLCRVRLSIAATKIDL
jgi:hypothetical protein